jgi:hypothetical protein
MSIITNSQDDKFVFPLKLDNYLSVLSKYYGKDDKRQLQEIIVNARPRIETGWTSNTWNGGAYGHAIFLTIPESIYLKIVNEKIELQSEIRNRLNTIHDLQNEFVGEVFFEMELLEDHNWRKASGLVISPEINITDTEKNRIWETEGFRVFLSHKTEVKKETALLKNKLSLYGVSCFVAHEDIHPTQEWQNEIENALHTMDSFVALITEDFHDSLWTDQEIGFAFGKGVPIIAIRLGKDPYGFIGKFQGLSSTWEEAPFEIIKILIKKEKMIDTFIGAVKFCEGFENSNKLSELLPYIERLSDSQIDSLIEAYNENSQVYDSFGFNGRKSRYYGEGLVHHLKRITGIDYTLNSRKKIERG